MALTSPGVIKSVNEILVQLAPEITAAREFIFDASDAVADYGQKVRIPFVNAGTAEEYGKNGQGADDPTVNFEHPTGGFADAFVTLDSMPKVTLPITQKDALELPDAPYWNRVVDSGRIAISKAISKKIDGLFTPENCLGGKVVLASVTKSNLAKLRGKSAARGADTVLILNPDTYNETIALFDSATYGGDEAVRNGVLKGLYGFKSVICAQDLPNGVLGALVPYNAVAVVNRGFSIPDPEAWPECGNEKDENGFTLTAMRHTSFANATCWFNVGCLLGADIIRKQDVKYIAAS